MSPDSTNWQMKWKETCGRSHKWVIFRVNTSPQEVGSCGHTGWQAGFRDEDISIDRIDYIINVGSEAKKSEQTVQMKAMVTHPFSDSLPLSIADISMFPRFPTLCCELNCVR